MNVGRDDARSFLAGISDELSATGEARGAGGDDRDPWGRAYGAVETLSGDGNTHGLVSTSGGAVMGASRAMGPNSMAGVALSYGHTDFSLRGLNQQGRFDTGAVGLYGETRLGALFVDAAGSLGYDHGQSTRKILFTGIARQAAGSFDGFAGAAMLTVGARLTGGGLQFVPSASLSYSHVAQSGFNESHGGGADLDLGHRGQDAVQSILQAKVVKPITLQGGRQLRTDLKVAWAHEWSPTETGVTGTFAQAGGIPMTVSGAASARDRAIVGGGLAYDASKQLSVYGRYQASFGTRQTDNAVSVGFKLTW